MTADSVAKLCERLERAGEKTIEWGERNQVEFNNAKHKAIKFKRRRKPELKRRIAKTRLSV